MRFNVQKVLKVAQFLCLSLTLQATKFYTRFVDTSCPFGWAKLFQCDKVFRGQYLHNMRNIANVYLNISLVVRENMKRPILSQFSLRFN